MKDFVTSIAFSEEEVCSQKFLRDFAAACRKMSPLAEFTDEDSGLEILAEEASLKRATPFTKGVTFAP